MKSIAIHDVLLTACAPLLWGTTYYVSTHWVPSGFPLFTAAMRALPIGLVLLGIVRELPQGRWWWQSFVLGFFNIGLFFALLFVAAVRLPGGVAATVGAIQPLIVIFLVWGLNAERPSIRTLGLATLGLVGVACLVLSAQMRLDGIGVVAAAGAAGAMGLGTVLTKRWGRPVKVLSFTAWQLVAGGLFLLPLAYVVEGVPHAMTPLHLFGFLYLALINTGLAYVIWFHGVARLPTTFLPLLGLLSPLMAVGIGYIALQQTLTWVQAAGAALVLASVALRQRGAAAPPLKAVEQGTNQAEPEITPDTTFPHRRTPSIKPNASSRQGHIG